MTPKRIKVGLVGCSKRALWYGAMFDRIDPHVYAEFDPKAYHHMIYYAEVDLQIPRATGFRLVKVYDRDKDAARAIANAFRTKPKPCETLDDVTTDVDLVFIANECGDGAQHRQLATPGLRKGIPTFVDRPLAATVKDAKAMVALARRREVPLLSCSHMRMLPPAAHFRSRFAEIGPLEDGAVQGHGPNPADIADGVELALFLFADGFRGRAECVQSMGSWPLEIMSVRYADRRRTHVLQTIVVNSHTSPTRNAFWAKARSMRNPVESPTFDAFAQTAGGLAVMAAIKQMVKTGEPPMSYGDMIESVAVMEAGRRAHNRARPVPLKKLR